MYYVLIKGFILSIIWQIIYFTGTNGVTLNISRRRPKDVHLLRQNFFSIDVSVFTGRNGHINEVVDNYGNIWKTDHTDIKSCQVTIFRKGSRLLHILLVLSNGQSTVTYFYRTGRVWNEVSEERFYDEFDNCRSESHCLGHATLYLNRKNSENKTRVNRTYHSKFASYTPSFGYRITKICEVSWGGMCFKSLWTQKNEEFCTYASFLDGDKPTYAYLIISNSGDFSEKFYHKTDGFGKGWKEIDRGQYFEKAKESGFDIENYNNNVDLDFDDIHHGHFYSWHFGFQRSTTVAYPKPGFKLYKVHFKGSLIWENQSKEIFCNYANMFFESNNPSLCYLMVTEGTERRILYFKYYQEKWEQVTKKRYYSLLSKRDLPRYTYRALGVDAQGNRKLEMSYFTNKQGLIIRTYRCLVPSHQGVVLIVHGLRSHFVSTFLRFNLDWNFKNFGFKSHPYIVCPDVNKFHKFSHLNPTRFKHVFEYNFFQHEYPFHQLHFFEYSGSLIECFNNMGYSVYGYDLQSHGFSEGYDNMRCHVPEYNYYLNDFLQFVYIIKRDKFLDTTQVWDEDIFSEKVCFKDTFLLVGFSLGSNVIIRTIEDFNRKYKIVQKFTDGVFSFSGMLDIKNDLVNWFQRMFSKLIWVFAFFDGRRNNPYQRYANYSLAYDFSISLNDDKYSPRRFTWNTLKLLFSSCDELLKYIKFYPRNLPTMILHSTEDPGCSIRGIRALVKKTTGYSIKSEEIQGNYHHMYKTESLYILSKSFSEWVEKLKQTSQTPSPHPYIFNFFTIENASRSERL